MGVSVRDLLESAFGHCCACEEMSGGISVAFASGRGRVCLVGH